METVRRMSNLPQFPEDLVNRICCLAIKNRGPHPFSEEIKTLNLIGSIIENYRNIYNEDAMDWLILDLDNSFPTEENNWSCGVFKKWKSLTPTQRRMFCDQVEARVFF